MPTTGRVSRPALPATRPKKRADAGAVADLLLFPDAATTSKLGRLNVTPLRSGYAERAGKLTIALLVRLAVVLGADR